MYTSQNKQQCRTMLNYVTNRGFCIFWIITFISIRVIIGACPEYECGDGTCYRMRDICDRSKDCSDGSDERDCASRNCGEAGFKCANHGCVLARFVCDGDDDCKDGSDETICDLAFKCLDGRHINQREVCNHNKDCGDGSDELNCTGKWSPKIIWEGLHGQQEFLSRKYIDDQVVFYFDSDVNPSITWPFEPVSKAWKYAKESYGSFGPNPLLYVLMHSRRNEGSRTISFLESKSKYGNIIDCGLNTPIPLTIKHSNIFNILITTFGHIIRKVAKEILNNADENICEHQMQEIVSYDVYKYIQDPSEEMEYWMEIKLKEYKKGIFWFRDWFLPIYEAYGEASVLERFYNLTYNYFRRSNDTRQYSKKLNAGEFVHFWSGAAGTDLQPLARQAFKCSVECAQEILVAQKEYPSFNYTVNNHILDYSDNNIALYFQTYRRYPSSFYEKISNAWQYVKSHYGPIHRHSSPTIFVNKDTTTTNDSCKSLHESQKSKNASFLYIVVCDAPGKTKESVVLDDVLTHIGFTAIGLRSKKENWWPAFDVSGWTMVSIIVYDIYNSLGYSEDAKRWLGNQITEALTFPRANTLWFQNWYFPIYNGHGKSPAPLVQFLNLLDEKWTAEKSLNAGEFVHFWSGATGTNLQTLAEKLMGWNTTYQQQLEDARKALPVNAGFNYTYDGSDTGSDNQKSTPDGGRDTGSDEQKSTPDGGSDTGSDKQKSTQDGGSDTGSDKQKSTPDGGSDAGSDKQKTTPVSIGGATVGIIIGILAVVLFGVLVIGGIKFYGYKRKIENLSVAIRKLTRDEVNEFYKGNPNLNKTEVNAPIQSQPFNKEYEIPRATLSIDDGEVLGSGEFGLVRSGRLSDERHGIQDLKVAIKTVKPNVEVDHFKALLSELKILAYLGRHESIASLLGTVTDNIVNREVFVVLEFCEKGDLQRYLRANNWNFQNLFKSDIGKDSKCVYKSGQNELVTIEPSSTSNAVPNYENPTISTLDLVKWSRQVAQGMAYLSLKNVVHGDLAARNVLLTEDNIAKISDFGLSRQLINYSDYLKKSTTPLPWRWMAIESLTTMSFSVHSDVWSYGVTLWEIFTLGKVPYPNRTWTEEFVNELMEGNRLNAPDSGNHEIYKLMLDCMKYVPTERVPFPQIKTILKTMEANLVSSTLSTSQNRHVNPNVKHPI